MLASKPLASVSSLVMRLSVVADRTVPSDWLSVSRFALS